MKPARHAVAHDAHGWAWDLLTVAVVAAVAAAHGRFLWQDSRLPRDPGLYYKSVPALFAAMQPDGFDAASIVDLVWAPTGWFQALLAAAMLPTGPSPWPIELAGWVSVLAVLCATGWYARRQAGPAAGALATLVVATVPSVVLTGRSAWIHVPEAALLLVSAALLARDPRLLRGSTVVMVAVLGALAAWLRHSGLAWALPLLIIPLLSGEGRPRWGRLAVVVATWGLGLLPILQNLQQYLEAKADAREKYAAVLPGLDLQLLINFGPFGLSLVAVGLLLALARRPRWWNGPRLLAVGWIAQAVLLWALFRAGLDNFTLLAPAAAVLAGIGLARLPRVGLLLALPVFLLVHVPQWLAVWQLPRGLHRVPFAGSLLAPPDMNQAYRPWTGGMRPEELRALADAVCPDAGPGECDLVVDQGLILPYGEDPGRLEAFLAGASSLTLHPLRTLSLGKLEALDADAVVVWNCPTTDGQWRARYPQTVKLLEQAVGDRRPAWSRQVSQDCSVNWMTEGGVLADPSRLVVPGVAGPAMGRPGMGQPGMGQPGMGQPGMGQPGMGQPGMGQPGMGQPGMGQPGMGQPEMGQPGMGQPGMGQPGMGQPGGPAAPLLPPGTSTPPPATE
ncbi:MAG: hypothetical protein H6742_18530 [Alphaproteobacteria bacterium]|nr:hypothetical protein [Alphaproteobacteria bacterium]